MTVQWIEVPEGADLAVDDVMKFTVGQTDIALFRLEDGYFATQDLCTHAVASLSDGYVEDDLVECPVHAAKFCIRTGAVRSMPASVALQTFPVEVRDGQVFVAVKSMPPS